MAQNQLSARVRTSQPAVQPAACSPSVLVPEPDSRDRRPHYLRHAVLVGAVGYAVLVVTMLAIGLALTHPLDHSIGRWDESVNRWLAAHRTEQWNSITGAATWFVNTLPAIGIAAVITGVLALRKRGREAAMLVIALALELAVFLSVTWVVARPRPDVARLNASPSTSSFPSGHTAAATVLFAGLAIVVTCCTRNTVARVFFSVLAVAVAALIGFARVYRGMHHPSDVVAGALLGAGCLVVAVLVVRATALGTPAPPTEVVRTSGERESRGIRSSAA